MALALHCSLLCMRHPDSKRRGGRDFLRGRQGSISHLSRIRHYLGLITSRMRDCKEGCANPPCTLRRCSEAWKQLPQNQFFRHFYLRSLCPLSLSRPNRSLACKDRLMQPSPIRKPQITCPSSGLSMSTTWLVQAKVLESLISRNLRTCCRHRYAG